MVDHTHQDIDAATGTPTTGHEWDGIKELNTPLPRWWLWLFYACIVWAFGYWVLYPAIPLPGGHTKGMLNWASRDAVQKDVDNLKAIRAPFVGKIEQASLQQISADPKLAEFARAYGRSAFGNNCAACHGSGGQGNAGYPNLAGDRWLWGGSLDQIAATITHGVRAGDAEGHDPTASAGMPAWSQMGLNTQQIDQVADYVESLIKPTNADVSAGQKIFTENCVACHGEDAKGNLDLGAPNLMSKSKWLYGSDRATVVQTIANGRAGQMPAWGAKLDQATIKSLTIYVHSLGGGQ
ncbi:cytochrome-c oxidase, cbb3-type subunit III [Rhodoblastus sphagnicola]|uniref:Cbb3-type cytochrome c oxidase subunit n=1 Tax=Rhodoblastus sphagnicola TaxID=333368 RepID=A0A2S6N5H1_9HYPH|nr:cytochrome-c oxidase, cbb3-type subunit III [Rhodoblastus sphagnicola]MBB4197264.1 cytochrome c oxidase cbb3-type subunit 3 [Rhodoblastus sphagnicola]PPQ29870.1 cytochrome-c oxidase, cbb3-type subunit III [Rhodoblastus sphagnicola]